MRKTQVSQLQIVLGVFAVLFVLLSISLPGFATLGNLLTLVQNVSVLGMLGLAMSVVVIGRGIDVSLVAAAVVPGGLVLQLAATGVPPTLAVLAGLGLAIGLGLVNGVLIAYAEIPALFVTLASGLFVAGLGQVAFFTLVTVAWPPELESLTFLGRGNLLGIPAAAVMFAVMAAVVGSFQKFTQIGQFIYAIGVNPAAARATGLPVRPIVVLQYVTCAVIAAFAGLVLAASVNSMPTRVFDTTLVYDVILVIVLGGIHLNGGKGGAANVIAGTLLIGLLLNAMTILNLEYAAQNLIKGMILLTTIMVDAAMNPRNEETSQQGDI